MTSQLYVGNFDFEHQLAGQEKPGGGPSRIAGEFVSAWLGIAEEGDWLWMPDAPDSGFLAEMQALGFPRVRLASSRDELRDCRDDSLLCCPWGWSPAILDWAEQHDLATHAPALDAVRIANSRRFSFELESEWNCGLPAAVMLRSLEECETALRKFAPDGRWVIKSEFGMSARERLLGSGNHLETHQLNWARKRIQHGHMLFLEPWVSAWGEAGIQFDVPPMGQGEPRLQGITPLLTDSSGMYRGSRLELPTGQAFDWSPAIEKGQAAAVRMQALGYFGPLGIDAMWYQNADGPPALRPLQDINARWTMGRLSLGFRRFLMPGELSAWLHFRSPATTPQEAHQLWQHMQALMPVGGRLLRTSPITVGNRTVQHATALVTATDEKNLQETIRRLHSGPE